VHRLKGLPKRLGECFARKTGLFSNLRRLVFLRPSLAVKSISLPAKSSGSAAARRGSLFADQRLVSTVRGLASVKRCLAGCPSCLKTSHGQQCSAPVRFSARPPRTVPLAPDDNSETAPDRANPPSVDSPSGNSCLRHRGGPT